MSKAKPPKPRRNQFHLVTPQRAATEHRNHRNHPLKGRGELVTPLARAVPYSVPTDRGSGFAALALRYAGPLRFMRTVQ
jgi:hypothetical protein